MPWLSPIERRILWQRRGVIALAVLLALLLISILDRPLFGLLYVGGDHLPALEREDWYRLFRIVGYLPTWLLVGAAIGLADRGTAHARDARAARLIAAPILAGLAAELLKLLIGRQRPIHNGVADGAYVYKPLLSGFLDGSNLGMPSSHAAVAFAGALALAQLWPRARPVFLLLAAGCALTRLLAGAHFASDIAVAALIGLGAARALRPGGWRGPAPRRTILLP